MRNKFFISVCVLLMLDSLVFAKVVNKTVAVVGSETILLSDFDNVANPIIEQYKKVNPQFTTANEKELKNEILTRMVEEKLMLQKAKKENIKASKRKTEKLMTQVKSQFKSDSEFEEELKKDGMTIKDFEAKIDEQVMMTDLIEKEVKAKVEIPTDAEVETYYKENEDKMVEPERVRIRHILVKVDANADKKTKDEALKEIEKIKKKIDKGSDFAQLAKENSDDTVSAERGGDLGFFLRGEMVPEFETAAFALEVGKTSGIVETPFGYHILRCEEKRTAQKRTLNEVREYLKQVLSQQRMEEKYVEWIASLKKATNITINEF
ncbi:MAG: peptidylprolyl isomerase [Elusimicrobiota bacterium]